MLSDDGDAFTVTSTTDGYTQKNETVTFFSIVMGTKQIMTNSPPD